MTGRFGVTRSHTMTFAWPPWSPLPAPCLSCQGSDWTSPFALMRPETPIGSQLSGPISTAELIPDDPKCFQSQATQDDTRTSDVACEKRAVQMENGWVWKAPGQQEARCVPQYLLASESGHSPSISPRGLGLGFCWFRGAPLDCTFGL